MTYWGRQSKKNRVSKQMTNFTKVSFLIIETFWEKSITVRSLSNAPQCFTIFHRLYIGIPKFNHPFTVNVRFSKVNLRNAVWIHLMQRLYVNHILLSLHVCVVCSIHQRRFLLNHCGTFPISHSCLQRCIIFSTAYDFPIVPFALDVQFTSSTMFSIKCWTFFTSPSPICANLILSQISNVFIFILSFYSRVRFS